jgi:predicted thioesterase
MTTWAIPACGVAVGGGGRVAIGRLVAVGASVGVEVGTRVAVAVAVGRSVAVRTSVGVEDGDRVAVAVGWLAVAAGAGVETGSALLT